jgi:hypothetical protein
MNSGRLYRPASRRRSPAAGREPRRSVPCSMRSSTCSGPAASGGSCQQTSLLGRRCMAISGAGECRVFGPVCIERCIHRRVRRPAVSQGRHSGLWTASRRRPAKGGRSRLRRSQAGKRTHAPYPGGCARHPDRQSGRSGERFRPCCWFQITRRTAAALAHYTRSLRMPATRAASLPPSSGEMVGSYASSSAGSELSRSAA